MKVWSALSRWILRNRLILVILVAVITGFMGYHASQVKLSYDFAKSIPTDNPVYQDYLNFKERFGQDGNLLVLGIQTDSLFNAKLFNKYAALQRELKQTEGVEYIIDVSSAIHLRKDYSTQKLNAEPIFPAQPVDQVTLDSLKNQFYNLPFYRGLLYNPQTNAWMMGLSMNKEIINSKRRVAIVDHINSVVDQFEKDSGLKVHRSGLPLIRTELASRIAKEMRWFLLASLILSALILLLFFRSISAMLLSLAVVIIGVVWSVGIMHFFHYDITLLTALIPPLIVVIGIPNCIYFLNKYHTAFLEAKEKQAALQLMIEKMGIVTLFCNLTAAIGFAVFALTSSEILQEFGVIAGISIMALFIISLALIPPVLSYLPAPKTRHIRYLENPRLQRWLDRLETWSMNHRRLIYGVTAALVLLAIVGMTRLQSVGYIVDDLPKTDQIYTDLKFFEKNFEGVMPLEIIVDTKKKYGVSRNLKNLQKLDTLTTYLEELPEIGKPLSITEGLKFAKQAFFEGDSNNYSMPTSYDLPALQRYLNVKKGSGDSTNTFSRLVSSFMDDDKREARISVNMADVGSKRLPLLLDTIQKKADSIFNKEDYNVMLTGSSVTFLEGSRYIINGLKDSIGWAFLFIALCMLYLFRSVRILVCSLIPNIIPLLITAGVMGWAGIALKPSTVLIFSVALGIAIDVTIRFLVNYKQERQASDAPLAEIVMSTIRNTGISIIYTSMVLIAGFAIFCFSGFGGTKALGWLTSLTLVTATLTNLVLLPSLLITVLRGKSKRKQQKG